MDSLETVAENIRDCISETFSVVRCSSATTEDQLAQEIATFGEAQLPGVVILIDSGTFIDGGLTRELTVGLALISRFTAGNDAKTIAAWRDLETLSAFFPPGGVRLGATDFLPSRAYAFRADKNRTGMLLELRALQCAEE